MMVKKYWKFCFALLVIASFVLVACQPAGASGKLEIFSWWTAGGEAEGLNANVRCIQILVSRR